MPKIFPFTSLTEYGQQRMLDYWDGQRQRAWAKADTTRARIYFNDRVDHYQDNELALEIYYAYPKGIKCAFRCAGDLTPVYAFDLVD